jgi:hypothetical protein
MSYAPHRHSFILPSKGSFAPRRMTDGWESATTSTSACGRARNGAAMNSEGEWESSAPTEAVQRAAVVWAKEKPPEWLDPRRLG